MITRLKKKRTHLRKKDGKSSLEKKFRNREGKILKWKGASLQSDPSKHEYIKRM